MKNIKLAIAGLIVLLTISSITLANGAKISAQKAQEIAKNHSKVSKDAIIQKTELDREDGRLVYEIKILDKNNEFEYDIDANTGRIINFSQEEKYKFSYHKNFSNKKNYENVKALSEIEIKKIALSKVKGAKEDNIIKFKRDIDNGIEVYEVIIILNNTRYEFDLNAQNGEIISWEEETLRRY